MLTAREYDWSMLVPHHAVGVRAARHRLAADLSGLLDQGLLSDVVAVAGELLGNAILHAAPLPGGVIRFAGRATPAEAPGTGYRVLLRVTDGGAEHAPEPRAVGPDSVDGRGLAIVAALARRWGFEPDGEGQCVWAELGGPSWVVRGDSRPAGA